MTTWPAVSPGTSGARRWPLPGHRDHGPGYPGAVRPPEWDAFPVVGACLVRRWQFVIRRTCRLAAGEFTEAEMADAQSVPQGVDTSVPAPARIYDYLLGGQQNFEADQVAAEQIVKAVPEIRDAAWANRGFHQRAARWIAEQGIRQFVDIGAGLPTVGNTHEVVQRVWPETHVVYVDND